MRLSKQAKKAVEDSIKHWTEDIVGPMLNGKRAVMIDECPYWDYDSSYIHDCNFPLCKEFPCSQCPLTLYFEKPCFDCGTLYSEFDLNPTLPNALKMVKALEEILEGDNND